LGRTATHALVMAQLKTPDGVDRGVHGFVVPVRDHLKGLLLTLKLNDDATVESLPRLFEQIQGWGAREVRALQLPSNRHDLFVYAPFDRPVKTPSAKRPGPSRR
jgi:hypothetical protein